MRADRFANPWLQFAAISSSAALVIVLAAGCGGGASSPPPPPPPPPPAAAATPAFFPVPGAYSQTSAGQMVTLTDVTAAATIYYTTDGSTPTTSSAIYANPITINATTTIKAIATASGFSASVVASGTYTLTPPGNGPPVAVVVTTDDQTRKLTPQGSVSFSTTIGGSNPGNPVYVDETEVYQPIEGFGAATTDTAMYNLYEIAKVKQPAQFDQAVKDLFTRQGNGIGLSFLRNPMGASDLARSVYSFDDNKDANVPVVSQAGQPTNQNHGQSLEPARLDENLQ